MNTATNLSAEELSAIVVDAAFHLHFTLGCGLLESVYQNVLAAVLRKKGLSVKTETPVVFEYDGIRFDDNLKTDLIVNDELIVELKSVEQIMPTHCKQLLTYLRLTGKPLGLLINFGGADFKKNCRRILNGKVDFSNSQLRINQ